jgi:O-methyltransferase involved in polyketide biosynthesis
VLHLACGLDTRIFRINPPETVRWVDVDYPDIIALRRALLPGPSGFLCRWSSAGWFLGGGRRW